ncbi:hypothetical protein AAW14_10140 [Streptomyces hygroscopicus]|nr:hypothetical protein [Streptomyces hygroscopicus]
MRGRAPCGPAGTRSSATRPTAGRARPAGLTGELSGGCCGLAGDFGFAKGHFEVEGACAEDQLLPAVRSTPERAVVLADGFSCRTRLEQLAGRRAQPLAQVLAQGLEGSGE